MTETSVSYYDSTETSKLEIKKIDDTSSAIATVRILRSLADSVAYVCVGACCVHICSVNMRLRGGLYRMATSLLGQFSYDVFIFSTTAVA